MTNKALVLLSGEDTSIPEAEARSLFLTYDPGSSFEMPERRVMVVNTAADIGAVGARIAFARRVGRLLDDPSEGTEETSGRKVRFRYFSLGSRSEAPEPRDYLRGLGRSVDLKHPEVELALVRGGSRDYLFLSNPLAMRQGWSERRPRRRPFFHPSAIFPKLSRALVNMSLCREGQTLLDPFAGTGSIPIEASCVGLSAVALDQSGEMSRGALANMKGFGQAWLGVVRADAFAAPITSVDGIATDVPYGRASSTRGKTARSVVDATMEAMPDLLKRGRRMVLMHPKHVPVEATREFEVEEEHYIYMHRRLTRAVTILRRR